MTTGSLLAGLALMTATAHARWFTPDNFALGLAALALRRKVRVGSGSEAPAAAARLVP